MLEVNVREVAERVLREHGCGWILAWGSEDDAGLYPPDFPDEESRPGCLRVRKRWTDRRVEVIPIIFETRSYEACERATKLWPEMKRLCDMLREACQ